jgi:hypothetical protein
MLKVVVVAATAAAFSVALVPGAADAATRHHRVHHRVHVVETPAPNYYGMPGNYYPAPPFPFFLVPGPWWLPAH